MSDAVDLWYLAELRKPRGMILELKGIFQCISEFLPTLYLFQRVLLFATNEKVDY
jgi:hypothetical protein